MRRVPLAIVILLLTGTSLVHALPGPLDDAGTKHDLVPTTNGTFLLGLFGARIGDPDGDNDNLTPDPVSWQRWTSAPPGCDRRLFVDLAYEPHNLTQTDHSPVDVPYTFRVTATQGPHSADTLIASPVKHLYLTTVPLDANVTIDLVLVTGIEVDWTFRVEGRQDFTASGCAPDPL